MVTTVPVPERRPPGRPRKFGQGRLHATVRFTPDRYRQLKEAADKEGRSISEEVEARVTQTFFEDGLADIRRGVAEVSRELSDIGQELLAKALARITELEAAQVLNEETIERAVAKALAKARLTIGDTKEGSQPAT
jgi:hypothetical protein